MPESASSAEHRDVVATIAAQIPQQDRGVAPTLLRARMIAGRDVLAYAATRGGFLGEELIAEGLRPEGPNLRDYEPELLAAYAQVVALQRSDPREQRAAASFYRMLDQRGELGGLEKRHLNLYAQLLYVVGDLEAARDASTRLGVTASVTAFLAADLLNPEVAPGASREQWLTALSGALVRGSTLPIGLLPDGSTPFDRLTAGASSTPVSGPLVTVITSAYNPGQPLLTAARSMVEQTWQDWELLVVDDASPAPTPGVLDEVAALDPRIRVIRKAVNGGTYRCRNTALRQARGDFFTCLDSDDWAHPQRLELGLAPLLADPALVATRSIGIRADENLRVTRPGYPGPFDAASSLLVRTQPVLGRIGFFDTVRKAADTEYARRIEAAFGQPVVDIPRDVLTILRSDPRSLSADDFAAGWRHEARPAYKQAYKRWHTAINLAGADPFLDPDGPRPFPAPRRWTRPVDPALAAPAHFDIVLGGDWRRFGGPQISMLQEIAACREVGMRIGVMHLEALRFFTPQDQPLCEPLQELIADGAVERVFPDDDIDVDVLIIRYPPILQFPSVVGPTFTPKRLYVMANQAPSEPDGSNPRYSTADVTAAAELMFGVAPQWIPQGPTIRKILTAELPAASVTAWDNPGLIDLDAWFVRGHSPVGERPVVGRFSRDDAIKFPDDPADLIAAYGLPEPYEVRMLGASRTVPRLLAQAGIPQPANWTLLKHKSVDVREFLRQVDFVVYMDNPNANEAFGRALLESAASGAVVIAAPKHQETFGEACVYAEPAEVPALLERFRADPQAYREQVARSHQWVADHFSTQNFAHQIAQIRAELPLPPAAGGDDAGRASGGGEDGGRRDSRSESGGGERWVSITTRALADGERADALAARHAGEQGARTAALAMLRDVVEEVPAGLPLTADLLAPLWRTGVTAIAQRSAGDVISFAR